jgi:hypothetical protein
MLLGQNTGVTITLTTPALNGAKVVTAVIQQVLLGQIAACR